jgi:hypothetical protein
MAFLREPLIIYDRHPEEDDYLEGTIQLPTGPLEFSAEPGDKNGLEVASRYLTLAANGLAHLIFVTPEAMDDCFEGSNQPIAHRSLDQFYRAHIIVGTDLPHYEGDAPEPVNDPNQYVNFTHYSFPAAPFIRPMHSITDFFIQLDTLLGSNILLLQGDIIQRVWNGRFDDFGKFLFNELGSVHSGHGRISDVLCTFDADWREHIIPNTIFLQPIVNDLSILEQVSSWQELWQRFNLAFPLNQPRLF